MIIDRYIIREIIKPTLAISTVLIVIFGCYISTRYGEDAVHGMLSGSSVIQLILLRIIIALEMLLPTTLYLSVVIALGRLYRDAELTAMFACGISMTRVIKSVFLLSIIGALIVACLSLFIRPWAWDQFFRIKTQAEANFDLTRMKGGNFYETSDGERVIFADKVDNKKNRAKRVFIQTKREDSLQIIYAAKASQLRDETTGKPILIFQDGHLYEFFSPGENGLILEFENSAMDLVPKDIFQHEYKVKAVATKTLLHSNNLEEIAELQWRLTAPLSIILLALLGIPLSRSSPRQGKYVKAPLAILFFAGYYTFSALTKKWVSQGVIGVVPGIWWGQILLAALIGLLLWQPVFLRHWRKR
ncbi:MAG: LPS export ABC transporter permease LptF [Thermodesulfobacteriota bacterium]|nr:LPS export ABC transporter permease LptF [Thermodesulfobacteriota bacterium]